MSRHDPPRPTSGRTRPLVHLSLSPEAIARLEALALERGQSRSGCVEQLIRGARLRDGT
jgi:ribbon-helix-helix CopG family protein